MKNKFRIVISVGDESGIGPEIILKALCSNEIPKNIDFTLVGSKQNLQKRYKIGQKFRMKVWEIGGTQILLTNKKSLMECEESCCIYQYSDAVSGLATLGVVSKISESGVQIHFFNRIKGLVPMSVLVKQGVDDPEDAFRIGQIAKCIVISLEYPNEYKGKQPRKAKPKILLSLDLGLIAPNTKEPSINPEKQAFKMCG